MDIQRLSKHYIVKRITKDDIEDVLQLCIGNPLFYRHCPPKPSYQNICADLEKLPPNKRLEDKYYLGFYSENTLIAVTDIILGYPNPMTIFIGFFMVNKEYQGKGIGGLIIKELLEYFSRDFMYVRLGYVLGNQQSENFWLKQKFMPTGTIVKEEAYSIVVLEKRLEG